MQVCARTGTSHSVREKILVSTGASVSLIGIDSKVVIDVDPYYCFHAPKGNPETKCIQETGIIY